MSYDLCGQGIKVWRLLANWAAHSAPARQEVCIKRSNVEFLPSVHILELTIHAFRFATSATLDFAVSFLLCNAPPNVQHHVLGIFGDLEQISFPGARTA